MWGNNTNGLSSTGLLRPTDSSSAIRRNYNYYYYESLKGNGGLLMKTSLATQVFFLSYYD